MTRTVDPQVRQILDEAKALLAENNTPAALSIYGSAFDRLLRAADHFGASIVAHMAGVAEPEAQAKHTWNVRALEEADAVEDRASVAGSYASLYNNLALSHALLGERDAARRCVEEAWRHVDALEPGPYADHVKAAIQRRLAEFKEAGRSMDG
jgi:hypothetical protein